MNRVDAAVACFEKGFTCSQAVLSSFGPELGLSTELSLRIGSGFGGGMARMGRTCGAVTGAIMVLGLKYGKTDPDDEETHERAYDRIGQFMRMFTMRHESTVCRELLGCDISTTAGREKARERGLFTTLCPSLVRDAAEILEDILQR